MTAVQKESRVVGVAGTPDIAHATAPTVETFGLCVTCNNVDTCTSRATWAGPVFHCEDFNDSVEVPPYAFAPQGLVGEAHAAVVVDLLGLCMNCGQQGTCGHHKPEGGVWHCEEYE